MISRGSKWCSKCCCLTIISKSYCSTLLSTTLFHLEKYSPLPQSVHYFVSSWFIYDLLLMQCVFRSLYKLCKFSHETQHPLPFSKCDDPYQRQIAMALSSVYGWRHNEHSTFCSHPNYTLLQKKGTLTQHFRECLLIFKGQTWKCDSFVISNSMPPSARSRMNDSRNGAFRTQPKEKKTCRWKILRNVLGWKEAPS